MAGKVTSIFQSLNLTYRSSNNWLTVDKNERKNINIGHIEGVEPRRCPPGHILEGEYGLFATKKFEPGDVIGEYVGVVHRGSSPYVADLHCYSTEVHSDLGVDSLQEGNELRFMNDYHGIAAINNVNMHRCFIDTFPRVLIVCEKAIGVGDEILTSYGEGYINYWILKKGRADYVPAGIVAKHSKTLHTAENYATPGQRGELLPIHVAGAGAAVWVNKAKAVPDTVYSHCEGLVPVVSSEVLVPVAEAVAGVLSGEVR